MAPSRLLGPLGVPLQPVLFGALVAAATVLPASGRGDVAVAGLLVGLTTRSRTAMVAVLLAVAAAAVRWGTTSMEALVGAQEVLGPSVTTGSTAAATSSALAALAVVLSARARWPGPGRYAVAVPVGLLAAVLAAGGDPAADFPVRLAVAVPAALVSLLVIRFRRGRADGPLGAFAVAVAASALAASAV